MSSDFTATIRKESPRLCAWTEVFGADTVPIKSPLPEWASAPGIEAGLFYQIDLTQLTVALRAKLVRYLAQRFGIAESEVAETLDDEGCPILDEDIVVTIHHPLRWI